MPRMILGIVAGFGAWFAAASVGNLLFRVSWPGYAEVEPAMTFTLAMMVARLILGALCSLCGGSLSAWLAQAKVDAAKILGVVLTVMFIPIHYGLRDKFPIWYHLIFLASLFPITLLGAFLYRRINRARLRRA